MVHVQDSTTKEPQASIIHEDTVVHVVGQRIALDTVVSIPNAISASGVKHPIVQSAPDSIPFKANTRPDARWQVLSDKLDSLSIRLSHQRAITQTMPTRDTVVMLNAITRTAIQNQPPVAAQQATDYSSDFLALQNKLNVLSQQLTALQNKPTTASGSPESTGNTAAVDRKLGTLQQSVDQQQSYAATQFSHMQAAMQRMDQQLNRLTALAGVSAVTGAAGAISPTKVEVVVPPDTQLTKALLGLQQAPTQDSQALAKLTAALQGQQMLWTQQLADKAQVERRLLKQVEDLQSQRDALAKEAAKGPEICRDTLFSVRRDTVRVAPKMIGLQRTNVYFQRGSTNLYPADKPALEALAHQLKAHPELVMHIRGYADNLSGSQALNLRLSAERAQHVKDFFLTQGVPEAQLLAASFGAKQPIYHTSLDRRVELEVQVATP